MSKFIKTVTIMLALAVLLTLAAGCTIERFSKNASSDIPAMIPDFEELTGDLVLYLLRPYDRNKSSNYYSYHPQYRALSDIIDLYKEARPDVSVLVTEFDDVEAYNAALHQNIGTAAGPDVIFYTNSGFFTPFRELLQKDWFINLQPYMDRDISTGKMDLRDYIQPLFALYEIDGMRPAVPMDFTIPAYLTSEETLEAAGLSLPEGGPDTAGLLEIITEFPRRMNLDGDFGYVFSYHTTFAHFLNLSDWWDPDVNRGRIPVDYYVKTATAYKKLVTYNPKFNTASHVSTAEYLKLWEEHKILLHELWPFNHIYLQYIYFDAICDQTPLLVIPSAEGRRTAASENYLALARGTDAADLGYDFIRFCLTEGQSAICGSSFPVRTDVYTEYVAQIKSDIESGRASMFTSSDGKNIEEYKAKRYRERYFEVLATLPGTITNAYLPDSRIDGFANESMWDMQNNNMSAEYTYTVLQEKMNAYLK